MEINKSLDVPRVESLSGYATNSYSFWPKEREMIPPNSQFHPQFCI